MLLSPGRFYNGGEGTPSGSDPHFSSVVLLSGFEGTDASTTLDDESTPNHTLTAQGNAQIDTAQFKFGTSSLLLDGTGDYVTSASSADWQLGSGDFTIEAWIRFNVNTTYQTLWSLWQSGTDQRSWDLLYRGADATDTLRVDYSITGASAVVGVITSAWTPTTGVWYHIALDRNGSTWRIYVDGVMLGKKTDAVTLHASTTTLRIGGINSGGEGLQLNGWMDELRITKGVSRYGATVGDAGFTAPTAAFPRS